MLSLKVSLFTCVLLATSLFLTVDHSAWIEQELNLQGDPNLGSGSVDASRPISMCSTAGTIPKGHHIGDTCPFNFALSLSQESLIQVQGSTSLVQLSVNLVSGTSVPVTVSAQGVPAGTQILFAPASAKPSFSSTVKIGTSAETPLGQSNITIFVAGGGLEKSAILSLVVVPIVHDMAIVSAKVQETGTVGSVVLINATVANYGSVSEAFQLEAYANTSLIAELSVLKLAPSAVYQGRLMWNTTGTLPGTYAVLVSVPPVQGEINLLDNSREAGKILLTATSGPRPNPSPAASQGGQGFNYGRQLAIVAAIIEAAIVFLVVLRRKRKDSTGEASIGSRQNLIT